MKKKNIDFNKFILILILALFVSNIANAQMTSIPDIAFEQYLVDETIDSDGVVNGQVLTNDISGVTDLSINSYDINSFEGLQFFSSLVNFTLLNNFATTNNSIDFSGNSQLLKIDIVNAPNLAQIDVSLNLQLTYLQVATQGNLLMSVDVSSNINLVQLELWDNALTILNTENNLNLELLNIRSNPITSIEVSHLSLLETLVTFDSQIDLLDLSSNTNLTTLLANDGALQAINLKNNSNALITYLDLRNNPNLTCILVDDTTLADSATDWFKDVTATYIEESIIIETEAQDIPLQYDSAGNYKIDIDDWLANNGGAVATSVCGEITWSHNVFEFFIQNSTNSIVYGVEFLATDIFGNTDSTVLDLTVGNINHFGEESYGSGDTICDDVFDINTVITNIDLTASLKASDILSKSFSRVPSFEFNEGPSGATFDDTDVDFPDTGAGSYSYLFKVSVEKSVAVYNPNNGNFEGQIIDDEAFITLNDKTVAFETEELDDITVSPGVISSIQYLTDLLIITPDPNILAPQNPIDLNQYWTPSVYSGSGTYTFDPTNAFPSCPSNAVSITVTEGTLSIHENELLKKLSIYPNPTKEMLSLKGDISMLKSVEIYSITGQQIMTVTKNLNAIDVSILQSALYFVKLNTENATKVIKIIKK